MRAMKPGMFGVVALSAAIGWGAAELRAANPYQPIVERNAFGLKPPPPPQQEAPKEEAKPPSKVKLTGVSNLSTKRAFLEIEEQVPGKAPEKRHVILQENEREHGVEVLAIDVEKTLVRIRHGNQESEITFELPKPSPSPAPGGGAPVNAGLPVVNPQVLAGQQQQQGNQPTIISSANNSGGSGGVTLVGGGSTGVGNANVGAGGVTSYGGTAGVPSPLGTETGLRSIPSRTIRTPSAPEIQQVDPAQQAILMEAERIRQQTGKPQYNRAGKPIVTPPLPPTPITHELQNPVPQ